MNEIGVVAVSNRPFTDIQTAHASLYTWIRTNVTNKILAKRHNHVSLSFYREDGFIINQDLYNENFNIPQYDEVFNKRVLYRVEEIADAIKKAKMHQRALLYIRKQGIDISNTPFDETEVFIISRFGDRKYNHPKHGEKVKQIIKVDAVDTSLLKEYINHFTITGKITRINRNHLLSSIIGMSEIDHDKIDNLKDSLGENDESYLRIIKSLEELNELLVYFTAMSDEDKVSLQLLPAIGHPNYVITPELRIKVFTKNSNDQGNNGSFYLDTIRK